jgi:hypothetical protein
MMASVTLLVVAGVSLATGTTACAIILTIGAVVVSFAKRNVSDL